MSIIARMRMKGDREVTQVDEVSLLPVGAWKFNGSFGKQIETVANARLVTEEAWERLYPQTEEAFRLREDDISHMPKGVWRGEFWGKYILGAIQACRYYGDQSLKDRIREAVAGLISTQDLDGYIGTYTDSRYYSESSWNVWCRKYTLWGLLEAWRLLEDDRILAAAVRFTDHLLTQLGPGGDPIIETGQMNGLPSTSILTPIVDVYRSTGEGRFLDFAVHIADQWCRHPEGPPDLYRKGLTGAPIHTWFEHPEQWAKSYEFISCVEGMIELYRVTGLSSYLESAKNIHELIRHWERNPVGGVSFNDKFIAARFLANSVAEVCDSVYWNRLSLQLFLITGEERYVDEIERVMYNALPCGLSRDGAWGLRRFRMTHVHIPAHTHFLDGHQCCVDNASRGLFQATQSAVFVGSGGITVALYEPGHGEVVLNDGARIRLGITGDYLSEGHSAISVACDSPIEFTMRLRIPRWSARTVVRVNGAAVPTTEPGSWLPLTRRWARGDEVTLDFELSPRFESFDPSVIAESHDRVPWHREQWAKLAFRGDAGEGPPGVTALPVPVDDSLPQQPMIAVFRGPLALARDVRLGTLDVLAPIDLDLMVGASFEPAEPPTAIGRAFTLRLSDGSGVPMCDFASAGNTWDERSTFSAWIPLTQAHT